jgi:hypothetical protein
MHNINLPTKPTITHQALEDVTTEGEGFGVNSGECGVKQGDAKWTSVESVKLIQGHMRSTQGHRLLDLANLAYIKFTIQNEKGLDTSASL